MNLTAGQQKDLVTIKYFIPDWMKSIPISDEDIKDFFEYSDRGKNKDRVIRSKQKSSMSTWNGFDALIQGKMWRGNHIAIYEEGIMSGDVPYYVLLGDEDLMSREVVDFLKKEMFRGCNASLMEEVYLMILENNQ